MAKQANRYLRKSVMMERNHFKKIIAGLLMIVTCIPLFSQEKAEILDYSRSDIYVLGGITISGIRFLDLNALVGLSGLKEGQEMRIPGETISNAAKKLWNQGLFSDVRITIDSLKADTAFLNIYLQERPRLSSISFTGLKTTEIDDITDKINMPIGSQITSYILENTRKIIIDHFVEKGFLNTTVDFIQKDDPAQPNNMTLTVNVDKKDKVKIEEITFRGNEYFDEKKLRRQMKDTKQRDLNIFKPSKYIGEKYEEDKKNLITFYNDNGFRDFEIVSDSMYWISEDRVGIQITVDEGNQYFLRDVEWVGNSVYRKEDLERVFNITKGSVYNQTLINDRLTGASGAEDAVSNLYLDYGYLTSQLTPVEANIENDSIDLQIRIYEGEQSYINDIIITGNTRTNEHVPRRELYTLPGDLFSKSDIMRSIRQLGVLGHFDPEKINPIPQSDITTGTVDLLYQLEEKANDQFEISGGWGAGMLVGTVGVRFNNFAMRNFFDLKEWRPYPSGDGQSLSIRAQSNGRYYQSYNLSFSEPWLGGKKPNSFSVSMYRSLMSNGAKKSSDSYQSMVISGAALGLGKRLEWPDDYFSLYGELNYQRYDLNDYNYYQFLFEKGQSNLLSFTGRISRFSVGPNLIYPRRGSSFTLSLQITPPYTAISGKRMTNVSDEIKYKWIEFHKWVFKSESYFPLERNEKLILSARFGFGYLGHYNKDIGPSPFENFYIGGDGMTGYSFYGREVIALRGYTNGSLTPVDPESNAPAGNVYSKITFELRYPVSLNNQATIYGLVFLEAGRAWKDIRDYNPFRMNRAAGVGIRANLPMFGLLGVDWGYGFDDVPTNKTDANKGQIHFVIGQQF